MLNSERVMAVCDLVKIGVFEQILKWGQEIFLSCHFFHEEGVLVKHILSLKGSNII